MEAENKARGRVTTHELNETMSNVVGHDSGTVSDIVEVGAVCLDVVDHVV